MAYTLAARVRLFLLERFKPDELQSTLIVAALIGLCGALATVGFRAALALLEHAFYGSHTGLVQVARSLPWWQRMLFPAAGGAVAGVILTLAPRWARPGSAGDYMEAITLGDGVIGTRPSLMRAASSAVTVASGSSIGREASMVQLAALMGALVGRLRNARRPRRRLLVACGAAAGISAAYNAPIAGALFVAEIILQSFAIETLAPLIVASVIANVTVHRFTGFGPIYHMPAFELQLGVETGAYALLGVLAGLLAPLFLGLLTAVKQPFLRLSAPLWLKLALGGLVVGAISVPEPGVWGNGYSVVDSVLQGGWAWQALLLILVLKVFATAAATGSGAVGGVFTPTLFVGAVIGALFSTALHALWPAASPAPAYIATGMGAFLAACTHAPLMSAVMIFEMTKNYDVVAPLLLASVLAFLVKRVLMEKSVYAHSLPAPKPDFAALAARDLLRTDAPTVPAAPTVQQLEQAFVERRWQHVYLVDDEARFTGAVSLHDFSAFMRQRASTTTGHTTGHTTGTDVVPADLIKRTYPRVREGDSLSTALDAFTEHTGERLPVVAADGRLLGYLSKTDLLLMLQESLA